MTQPIGPKVACLLMYLATRRSHVPRIPHLLEGVALADAMEPCPIKHLGEPGTMDWSYLQLTSAGQQLVEEMIAAARAVTKFEEAT